MGGLQPDRLGGYTTMISLDRFFMISLELVYLALGGGGSQAKIHQYIAISRLFDRGNMSGFTSVRKKR